MPQRFAALLLVLPLVAITLPAQGINTNASPTDWEEINFEYNSSVVVDGFPSMLRLAELLQRNAGYRVTVEGHTDRLGGDDYNTKLGQARANAVRDFLIKYGARANQITVATRGRANPKYPGQRATYGRTDEARYMNRRVVLTVMDEQGRVVGEGGPAQAIRAIEPPKPPQAPASLTDCCSEVLKRLDKLDDIAKMLQDLANQNADLRKQLDDLRNQQQVLQSRVNQPPPTPPSPPDVAGAVAAELEKNREPRFQLLGVNIGSNQDGGVTFTGKGRFFAPFATHFAFQAQGEYLYNKSPETRTGGQQGMREGQFDFGLLDRVGKRFQAGLFASFKHVTLGGNQTGGTLGQAALTLDYIFKWGRLGVFGTKGFLDNALINTAHATLSDGTILNNLLVERYLKIVDQAGASATLGLFGNTYLELNGGYLKSVAAGDRFGGTARFIFPMNDKVAFTVEGGINETMLTAGNNGRAVVGVQFGNMMRPKEYLGTARPVPADVPRVRYEVLTRRLRIGNAPPVADAGPDQIGVPAGTIHLDGSASYDPDGDPLTFQWVQEAGPAAGLTSPTGAKTDFTAGEGQSYTFRLVVRDDHGGQAFARVHVTTTVPLKPQILFFTGTPPQITTGQSSTLAWQVVNADTVTISSLGNVPLTGSRQVSPPQTTTYVLTATGGGTTVTAQVTITVTGPAVNLTSCFATPSNIMAGESATLNFQAVNAASVSIDQGIGAVGNNGPITVTPMQTTTYTITATGPSGTATASCSITVTVTAGSLPRIIRFSAVPSTIMSGQTSTLLWQVENATTVSITSLGTVGLTGTQDVSPAATTTYTLTATNAVGSVTAMATVNVTVIAPPKITSFTATPPTSPSSGSPVTLTCVTTGAVTVTMAGILFQPANAASGYKVYPTTDTTYTCIATGQSGQTDTQTVTVKVTPPPPPPNPSNNPVVVVAGGYNLTTIYRFIYPDASASFSPLGNNPLTYNWTVRNSAAVILNANSPTPVIEFGFIGGTYQFDLTVTDSKGNSTTQLITILFANLKVQ